MRRTTRCTGWSMMAGFIALLLAGGAAAGEAVLLRVETLTVPPSTRPLLHVLLRNAGAAPYQGTLAISGPEGWRLAPAERPVDVPPGQTARVPFTIEQGRNVAANRYAFQVTATAGGESTVQRLETCVASAPYFKPTIDGRPDEWQDAIPIDFPVRDRRTVVAGYWNRRQLSLLISVQEQQLVRYAGADAAKPFDAVQVALAPLEPAAGADAAARAGRFEFLLAAGAEGARCFRLAEPATELPVTQQPRPLEPLACSDVQLAVHREGDLTHYECAIPFRALAGQLEPAEGREFYLAVLVHDPDGTGLRDLGTAAGLWPEANDRQAWSRWPGAVWGDQPPRNSRVRWGFCTSKY